MKRHIYRLLGKFPIYNWSENAVWWEILTALGRPSGDRAFWLQPAWGTETCVCTSPAFLTLQTSVTSSLKRWGSREPWRWGRSTLAWRVRAEGWPSAPLSPSGILPQDPAAPESPHLPWQSHRQQLGSQLWISVQGEWGQKPDNICKDCLWRSYPKLDVIPPSRTSARRSTTTSLLFSSNALVKFSKPEWKSVRSREPEAQLLPFFLVTNKMLDVYQKAHW